MGKNKKLPQAGTRLFPCGVDFVNMSTAQGRLGWSGQEN